MNQERSREEEAEYKVTRLRCRRTDQWVVPAEHTECRYCFGSLIEVEHGHYQTFCDYRPGVDPPGAEFPGELERYTSG